MLLCVWYFNNISSVQLICLLYCVQSTPVFKVMTGKPIENITGGFNIVNEPVYSSLSLLLELGLI